MKKRDVRAAIFKALSITVVFSLLAGAFSAFPFAVDPTIKVLAADDGENIYTEGGDPYVLLDAEYMKNGNRLSGNNQCEYSFVTDSDGRTLLRLVTKPKYDDDTGELKAEDPYISFNIGGSYSADVYKYVTILARVESKYCNATDAARTNFRIFYNINVEGKKNYHGDRSKPVGYGITDQWQLLTYDMSNASLWSGGSLTGIRFDFYEGSLNNEAHKRCDIGAVILSKTPMDVYNASFELMQSIYPAEQRLSDFTEGEIKYFTRTDGTDPLGDPWPATLDTTVSERDGNLLYTFDYDTSIEPSRHPTGDPYAGFFYKELMAARGEEDKTLSTSDFRYTVMRYRTSGDVGNPRMQLYLYANGNRWPTFIDGYEMAPATAYTPSTVNDWKTLVVDMAYGNAAKGWKGEFEGFRVDWCSPSSSDTVASMEVSDILFFKDGEAANAFSAALNQIMLPIDPEDESEDDETVVDDFVNPIVLNEDSLVMLPDELDGRLADSENTIHSIVSDGGIKVIKLETTKTVSSPYITLKPGSINADEYKYITLAVRKNVPSTAALTLKYTTESSASNEGTYRRRYDASNQWQLVTFDLENEAAWEGTLSEMTLYYLSDDPTYTGYAEKTSFEIAGIAFSKTTEAFYDSAYYLMTQALRPVQVLSGFTESDIPGFASEHDGRAGVSSTSVTVNNGDLRYSAVGDYADPFAVFHYKKLMDSRGVSAENRITTADFTATVIRYRTSEALAGRSMELFIYTGSNYKPFQVNGKTYSSHTGYAATYYNTWRSMCIVMNADPTTADGWSGDFNGFRVDWCNSAVYGDYMDVSEFFFFETKEMANRFTEQVNTLYKPAYNELDESYMTSVDAPEGTLVLSPADILGKVSSSESSEYYLSRDGHLSPLRLEVAERSTEPYVSFKYDGIDADEYKFVTMAIRTDNEYGPYFKLSYTTDKSDSIKYQSAGADFSAVSGWQIVTLNMSNKDSWSGIVDELRMYYLQNGFVLEAGEYVEINGMAFCKTEEQVFDAASYMLMQIYRPMQVLDDFTDEDLPYFGGAAESGRTSLSTENGNIIYSITDVGSDPQKEFNYLSYAQSHELKALTTDKFRYTVIRYKSRNVTSPNTELYTLTGDAKDLFDMTSILNRDPENPNVVLSFECRHKGIATYDGSTEVWRSMFFDMARGDGYTTSTHLKNGWYREDGNYTFKGFRFDWCETGVADSSLTVSDFLFFADAASALSYSAAVNTVNIPYGDTDPEPDPLETEVPGGDTVPDYDETDEGEMKETLPSYDDTDIVDDPDETVPGFDNPDETIPDFDDPDETRDPDGQPETEESESDGEATEIASEIETEEIIETESSCETEEIITTETESTDVETESSGGDRPNIPGGDVGDIGGIGGNDQTDEPKEQGSQMPFYIACGCLAALSVVSVVTVIVIKIKERA